MDQERHESSAELDPSKIRRLDTLTYTFVRDELTEEEEVDIFADAEQIDSISQASVALNATFSLEALKYESSKESRRLGFRFFIKDQSGKLLEAGVYIKPSAEPSSKKIYASTDIQRFDPSKKLRKGFALEFYQKALDVIQSIADEMREDIEHAEYMSLEISDTPMTKERWKELFEPIFRKHLYEQVGEVEWTKVYKPST